MAVTGTPTTGNDILQSDGAADSIDALAGNDVLIGAGGNDTLEGNTGADTMIGGDGSDSYRVDDAGDVVSEDAGVAGDVDTVNTSISYTLGTNLENLVGRGSGSINLTGNTQANTITGNAGNNAIYGGDDGLNDTLIGGQGNDSYTVAGGGNDVIQEDPDNAVAGTVGGVDEVRVIASLTQTQYTIAAGQSIESLYASDAASTLGLNLTGNDLAQTIVGNAGVNTITGGGGADTLIGLGDNDIYNVATTTTVVTEADGGGSDIVNITGPGSAANNNTGGLRDYTFTGAIEQIAVVNAAGTNFLNITGGATSQSITGNAGVNVLNGGGGTDTLIGLGGNDTYNVDSLDDVVNETIAGSGGFDRVVAASSYALSLDATVASNIEQLVAAGSNFATATGQGDGTFDLNAINTTVTSNYFVGDNLTFQTIFGDAGANILNGRLTDAAGGSNDQLIGLGGSDTYRVYNQGDVVVEDANGGTFDFIYTSGDYNLATNDTNAANVFLFNGTNNVTLGGAAVPVGSGGTGLPTTPYLSGPGQIEVLSAADQNTTNAMTLTGNAYGQIIIGNFGANTINDGGSLVGTTRYQDQLAGLRGNDTYNVTAQNTTVNENVGEGTDVVNVTLAAGGFFTLIDAAEVEFLNAGGAAAFNLRGNQYNQVITGNGAANNLDGNGGQDTLVGGAGSDTYVVTSTNAANVSIIEAAGGADVDTVSTSVTFDLGANTAAYTDSAGAAIAAGGTIGIEAIVITNGASTDAINLTGNGAAQILVGNFGNNVLDGDNDTRAGGAGTPLTGTPAGDTLTGLLGNDTYRVYSQNDIVRENAGEGTDVVFSSGNYQLRAGNSVETLSSATQTSTTGLTLIGNEFAQTVIGTDGADTIWGGQGNDTLFGRGGSDVFGINETGAANADTLQDFTPGDFIGLSTGAFGAVGGSLTADEFVVGTAAADANDYIIYNQTTGQLFYDADGSGSASVAVLFAQLIPGTALGFNDFSVIAPAPATPPAA